MLESKDAVLVATSLVLAVSTVVSVSIELERQATAVGRLTASKCECCCTRADDVWPMSTDFLSGFLVISAVWKTFIAFEAGHSSLPAGFRFDLHLHCLRR